METKRDISVMKKFRLIYLVLPLARKHFSFKRQCELLYQSLCMMPLKLIERVIPWLIGSLTAEETKMFLRNMQLAEKEVRIVKVRIFSDVTQKLEQLVKIAGPNGRGERSKKPNSVCLLRSLEALSMEEKGRGNQDGQPLILQTRRGNNNMHNEVTMVVQQQGPIKNTITEDSEQNLNQSLKAI
ncbi:hypothetical protein Ahy_A03g014244 isoform A [Arachis hypogaea]|uniref:Uncharacterized protein n=1 Tax=Arachis hypogaea TaxID=3818 RepID=A0A445DXK8_ARAHY|nr:hypothetical protein Ahy_A03g014244 isoform A [Arachis hypogaea]